MNKCYFCGKDCGETILTVSDKTSFQSEQFRAYMCAECSEAVHSALILLRTITNVQPVKHGKWEHGKCTNCEKSLEDLFEGDFYYDCDELHFCPNCGARMMKDGDAE